MNFMKSIFILLALFFHSFNSTLDDIKGPQRVNSHKKSLKYSVSLFSEKIFGLKDSNVSNADDGELQAIFISFFIVTLNKY